MEKNGGKISSWFVLATAMVMIINILSVSQVEGVSSHEECVRMCKKACSRSPVYDFCMQDCMDQCEHPPPPPPPVSQSQSVHYCNLGCANSLCRNFISDKEKMEGCRDSCSKSCNKIYTQTSN
ncbi:hypothetical protein ACOSP7_020878 [Xanthoceras sorbifolium]